MRIPSRFSIAKVNLSAKTVSKYLLLLCCVVEPAYAGDTYLSDPNVKVARHDRRTSVHRFNSNPNEPLSYWGTLFQKGIWEKPSAEEKRLLHYEELPKCSSSEVKLDKVYSHTAGTEGTDVLYYAPDDPAQVAKAKGYQGFKVPYNPALLADPKTNLPNSWQAFARFIQVDCLPQRFRFTYIGNERYMEFRLGDKAWAP